MAADDLVAFTGAYCPFVHCGDDSPRPKPWSIIARRLSHYLLVYSREGAEELTVEGRTYHVPEGGAYLIQPGWLADLRSQGSRPAWLHFDVRFDPRRREHPFSGAYESDLTARMDFLQPTSVAVWGVTLPVVIPPPLWPRCAEDVPWIIARWRRGDPLARLEAAQRLNGLLLTLVEQEMGEPAVDPCARLFQAEAVARRSLDTDFQLDDFAAAAGYGRSRFCALYRQHRGISPGAFLKAERLTRAQQLLGRSDLTVAEIGTQVGYADATVFGRVFRAATGLTPGGWRAKQADGSCAP